MSDLEILRNLLQQNLSLEQHPNLASISKNSYAHVLGKFPIFFISLTISLSTLILHLLFYLSYLMNSNYTYYFSLKFPAFFQAKLITFYSKSKHFHHPPELQQKAVISCLFFIPLNFQEWLNFINSKNKSQQKALKYFFYQTISENFYPCFPSHHLFFYYLIILLFWY